MNNLTHLYNEKFNQTGSSNQFTASTVNPAEIGLVERFKKLPGTLYTNPTVNYEKAMKEAEKSR